MGTSACYPEKAPVVDSLLDVLRHHLRREVVNYFENHTTAQTAIYDDLVTHIARRVPSSTRRQLQIELGHVHLPKLAKNDWLTYDASSREIEYHGHDAAKRLLSEVHDIF